MSRICEQRNGKCVAIEIGAACTMPCQANDTSAFLSVTENRREAVIQIA